MPFLFSRELQKGDYSFDITVADCIFFYSVTSTVNINAQLWNLELLDNIVYGLMYDIEMWVNLVFENNIKTY